MSEEFDPSQDIRVQAMRQERDRLLKETDHWAFQDTPDMTQEQIDYRQALRDIPSNYTNILDVVWPTKP